VSGTTAPFDRRPAHRTLVASPGGRPSGRRRGTGPRSTL